MGAYSFVCPHCQQPLEAPEETLGQIISCPACNQQIQLPAPERPAAGLAAPAVQKKIVMRKNNSGTSSSTREEQTPSRQSPAKTSPGAIWSLVLGILGLTCFGPLAGVPAIICGHVSLGNIRRSGGAVGGGGLAIAGLILGYVGIAVMVLLIPLYAAIAIPSFVKARDTARQNACVSNLRQIDSAKEQWAMANNVTGTDDVVVSEVNRYINGGTTPICPAGGTYSYNAMGTDPTCTVPGHSL